MPFLYTVLLVASVFFYILYEHAFSFYLFAFLFLVPVVLLIMTIYTARRTKVSFVESNTTAGRSARIPVKLRVTNNSMLPCPNLLIEIEYCNLLDGRNTVMKINTPVYPKESQLMTLTVSGMHCGTVNFRIKRCRISDMLKLFTLRIGKKESDAPDKTCTLTILPEYTPLENSISDYSEMGLETDEYSKTKKGDDPSEIFDIRDYADGDKLNRVHWKLSAKQDKTMVKDYSLPLTNSIMLMLDLVKPSNDGDELAKFDSLIETAASLSQHLLDNGVPHRVVFFDKINNRLVVENITDEESHGEMIAMLLRAQMCDKNSIVLHEFMAETDNLRCGHILYISNQYSPEACELMNEAELAFKYSYLLMMDDSSDNTQFYDEYAEIVPVFPGRLGESIQELCL